jgi:hypothetical protein
LLLNNFNPITGETIHRQPFQPEWMECLTILEEYLKSNKQVNYEFFKEYELHHRDDVLVFIGLITLNILFHLEGTIELEQEQFEFIYGFCQKLINN